MEVNLSPDSKFVVASVQQLLPAQHKVDAVKTPSILNVRIQICSREYRQNPNAGGKTSERGTCRARSPWLAATRGARDPGHTVCFQGESTGCKGLFNLTGKS